MANLLGSGSLQYKGILNLDATTVNTPLDATLRAVTDGMGTSSPLQLSTTQVGLNRTIAFPTGTGNNTQLFNVNYTINNSGLQTSSTGTGIFLNATETVLNGMTHNLMDLQVGGTSRFRVENNGIVRVAGTVIAQGNLSGTGWLQLGTGSQIREVSSGVITLLDAATTSFNRVQFGGTTSAFPALKRNGAALEVRLADDSGLAALNTGSITANGSIGLFTFSAYYQFNSGGGFITGTYLSGAAFSTNGAVTIGVPSTRTPSAQLEVESTTRGFLPPRMTTTQRDAIASPAAGLQIHNTTTNRPNFFDGSVWVAL